MSALSSFLTASTAPTFSHGLSFEPQLRPLSDFFYFRFGSIALSHRFRKRLLAKYRDEFSDGSARAAGWAEERTSAVVSWNVEDVSKTGVECSFRSAGCTG